MKRKACLFLLFAILFTGFSNRAEAQFWKKLFGKKETKRSTRPAPARKPVVKEKPVTAKKKQQEDYPATVKKDRYRVHVFAPLYLDELIKNNKSVFKGKLPEKAVNGLDFYEGVKLAADTLNKLGYNIDLYVHDVTQPGEFPEALISSKVLDSADLIIGAVHNKHVPVLAGFAKKKNINFVSAYSPSDVGIKNNPYFILVQPSLESHCKWIMSAMREKYVNRAPVVLCRTSTAIDSSALAYLNLGDNYVKKISCNSGAPSREKLNKLFDSTIPNLVLMPIMNAADAEKILLQLYAWYPEYQFVIYGMPSWRSMPSLKKPDAYPNIVVYISSPFYFDISTGPGHALAQNYKEDVGGSKPGDMVFRGYEAMYWYSYLLSKYGTIFNGKFSDNAAAPFTRFDIKTRKDKDDRLMYQENTHIYLYRFQSSSYMVEQ